MPIVQQVNRAQFEDEDFQSGLNQFASVYLAEGDSWFSYGSLKFKNLLTFLALPVPVCVLNIAEPGDTLRRMENITSNAEFFFYLKNKSGRRWRAILLSGGGNDLIDAIWDTREQKSHILTRPVNAASIDQTNLRSVINQDALDALFNYIRINVAHIISVRDSADSDSQGVPILMHTYALPRPRNSGVKFLKLRIGPWLFPACQWLGIDEALWLDLSRILLEELAGCIKSLSLPNVHVVDTLSTTTTMVPAAIGSKGDSNDWENEIHPNASGYTKLAATWADAIAALPFS
jgi:lysophospholipase L1-like esterase